MSPRTGRPKSDNPKTERLYIRISPDEKKEIQDFTSKSGHSLLDLIRIGISALKKK
ncbi:hypothetical protein HW273_05660 [Oribacterium sp. oral taxon 102]|uniref:hypothetical protein n=1 Tax=Oribacterium sp. oral taxon 102 TaxID=671214 RepID=UPI0015C04503|nr:hypothetical protein [Oribacterium sp. oral taxon 102]NWO21381.1 hypothetical protein [Oribacterium sp. oral taxon 102]